MSLRITTPDSFASNNIGWRAPTSVQPAFASFFNGSTKNLVAGGVQPSALSGIAMPQLTARVAGSALPYAMTQGGSYGMNLNIAQTPDMTFMALVNTANPSGSDDGVIVSTYGQNGARGIQLISQGSTWHLFGNPPSGQPLIANLNEPSWGSWRLLSATFGTSTTAGTAVMSDLTGGITADATATITADTGSGPSLWLGTDPTSSTTSNTGTVQHAFFGLWPEILSSADQQAMRALLQNYAAQDGQTC